MRGRRGYIQGRLVKIDAENSNYYLLSFWDSHYIEALWIQKIQIWSCALSYSVLGYPICHVVPVTPVHPIKMHLLLALVRVLMAWRSFQVRHRSTVWRKRWVDVWKITQNQTEDVIWKSHVIILKRMQTDRRTFHIINGTQKMVLCTELSKNLASKLKVFAYRKELAHLPYNWVSCMVVFDLLEPHSEKDPFSRTPLSKNPTRKKQRMNGTFYYGRPESKW